jgi:hypothetical protein
LDQNDAVGIERDNTRATLLDVELRCSDLEAELATHGSLGGNNADRNDGEDPVNELVSELQIMVEQRERDASEHQQNIEALKDSLQKKNESAKEYFRKTEEEKTNMRCETTNLRHQLENTQELLQSETVVATRAHIEHTTKTNEMKRELQGEHQRAQHESERLRSELDVAVATSHVQGMFSTADKQSDDIFRMVKQLCETTSKLHERIENLENRSLLTGR